MIQSLQFMFAQTFGPGYRILPKITAEEFAAEYKVSYSLDIGGAEQIFCTNSPEYNAPTLCVIKYLDAYYLLCEIPYGKTTAESAARKAGKNRWVATVDNETEFTDYKFGIKGKRAVIFGTIGRAVSPAGEAGAVTTA